MAPKSRGKPKGAAVITSTSPSATNTKLSAPFSKAAPKVLPFLEQLPKNHIYITHVDEQPPDFKKKIFLVPVAFNIAILLLIFWRLKSILPFYLQLISASLGYPNATTLDASVMSWAAIIRVVGYRAGNMFFDLALYVFVLPWPQAFFIGTDFGTPIEWRWAVRFREKEIVIRRSKRWDEKLGDVFDTASAESRQFGATVKFAVSKAYMQGKTAYSLLNQEWELDFLAMVDATRLIDEGHMELRDFDVAVYLHSDVHGWLVFDTKEQAGGEEDKQRRKIIAFKDELTALGKENLFFKWIELIQFEASQPGGFGLERQAKTIETAKAMFQTQGVDFEKFWTKVGGMDGLPGMEQFR